RAFGFGDTADFDPFLLLDDFRNENPEDYLAGFPWHPHRGIETATYVLAGSVEHGDSPGNRGRLGPGDVQRRATALLRREDAERRRPGLERLRVGEEHAAHEVVSRRNRPPRVGALGPAGLEAGPLAGGEPPDLEDGRDRGPGEPAPDRGPVRPGDHDVEGDRPAAEVEHRGAVARVHQREPDR